MFNLETIDQHFPKEHYRDGQREAIEFILKSYNEGKNIVILESPTGSGKSAIAMTVADMVRDSYYLTITKVLQDQIVGDFGDQIVELKGRNAYPCTFWNRKGSDLVTKGIITSDQLKNYHTNNANCATGFCRTKHNKIAGKKAYKCPQCFVPSDTMPYGELETLPPDKTYSACPYYEQVYLALNSRKVVMNFSSFLYQTQMTKRFDTPRELMIIDEAHNVEPQLLDFVSLTISDQNLYSQGIIIPQLDSPYEYALWFDSVKLHDILFAMAAEASASGNIRAEDEYTRMLKKYAMFMDHISKHDREWVCDYEQKRTSNGQVLYRTVVLRPVFAVDFVQPLLFRCAKKILMMSATILDVDVVCRSLGINRSQVAAYRMRNRFPKDHRPIYLNTVGKMTGGPQRMPEWAPAMAEAVNDICRKYQSQKGIIHTHNFAIMDYIIKHCNKTVTARLLDQREFKDKSAMLRDHARKKNSILIAPAMHEGIDLVGDLSRFQIICKVPYANCFDDKQLARRVEIDRKYYLWLTALKLCQSYGRSVRSEDDYADTYVLDESIHKFLSDAKSMIPEWFKEAIVKEAPVGP